MRRSMCMGILRCYMIKEENVMRKKMGRSVCLAAVGLFFLLGVRMPAQATETEGAMTLQKTVKDAEIKESPEEGAKTLGEIEEGTGVIVYGEPQDSWSQVEYGGVNGYMKSDALEFYVAGDEGELEKEFEVVSEETVRLVEESELIRKSRRTSAIWGGVIAVLVATIFVVGVVSAIKKDKEEKEEEKKEEVEKKEEEVEKKEEKVEKKEEEP